jgi:hypothetical protein
MLISRRFHFGFLKKRMTGIGVEHFHMTRVAYGLHSLPSSNSDVKVLRTEPRSRDSCIDSERAMITTTSLDT